MHQNLVVKTIDPNLDARSVDALQLVGWQGTRGAGDQRSRGPKGPEEQRTRGPEDQRTRWSEDQRAKGPEDKRNWGEKIAPCKCSPDTGA